MMDDLLKLKPRRRLRAGSARELRLLRLMWLLGWRVEDMAETLEEAVRTVRRRLAGHELMGEEAPGERARLVLAVMTDRLGDGLVGGEDVREAALSLQRAAGAVRGMQAIEAEGGDDAGTEEDEDDNWQDKALLELERMVRMGTGIETKSARSGGRGADAAAGQGTEEDAGIAPVSGAGA